MKKLFVYGGIIGMVALHSATVPVDKVHNMADKNVAADASAKPKKPKAIVLKHPLIQFMDKILGAGPYGLILQVRREVRKRLYGVPTKSGARMGIYKFDGKNVTVTSLAKIESQYEMEYFSQKDYLIKNKANYDEAEWTQEMDRLETEYQERTKVLQEILDSAKEDFLAISEDYVESARGTKEQSLILIKESCDRRGVKNCFILRWGEAEEGNETELLRKDVMTFKEFAKFLYDLSNFLEDMARSCPRSRKKFIDFVKQNRRKPAPTAAAAG